tara:strand:+ start:3443 stop:3727 length:285 start_codon:yes stop_codon:yes gene_type:complete
MALPTQAEALSLDYIDFSLPVADVDASSSVVSGSLDYIDFSLPIAAFSVMGPSFTAWVNVSGTWKQADSIHVNVSGTWKEVEEIQSNISSTWKA